MTRQATPRNHFRRLPPVLDVLDLPGSQLLLPGGHPDHHEPVRDLLPQLGQWPTGKAVEVQTLASVAEQRAIVERLADQKQRVQPPLDQKILVAHAARVLRKFRSTHETDLINRSIAAFLVTTTLVLLLAMLRRKGRVPPLPRPTENTKMALQVKTSSFPRA